MKLRLGSIEFINSLPVDLGLLTGAVRLEADFVQGSPVALNNKLLGGELDISPVSSFFYAEHADRLVLLPELSISSESSVESVLLFSREKIENLKNQTLRITGKGRTTPALLEILCRERYDFRPRLELLSTPFDGELGDAEGVLLIGDEALEWKQRLKRRSLKVTDLAEEWREWTKLPFVFAVWAARRDFFSKNPGRTLEAWEAILRSRDWGFANMEQVFARSEQKTGLPKPILQSYFSRLSYDFNEKHKKGMALYFEYAVKCGLLEAARGIEEVSPVPSGQFLGAKT